MYKDSLLKSNTKRKSELLDYLHERHELTSADFSFSQFAPEMYIGRGGFGIVKLVHASQPSAPVGFSSSPPSGTQQIVQSCRLHEDLHLVVAEKVLTLES